MPSGRLVAAAVAGQSEHKRIGGLWIGQSGCWWLVTAIPGD